MATVDTELRSCTLVNRILIAIEEEATFAEELLVVHSRRVGQVEFLTAAIVNLKDMRDIYTVGARHTVLTLGTANRGIGLVEFGNLQEGVAILLAERLKVYGARC